MFGALTELAVGIVTTPLAVAADLIDTPGKIIEGKSLLPLNTLEHVAETGERIDEAMQQE